MLDNVSAQDSKGSAAGKRVVEYDAAIKSNCASFNHLAAVVLYSRPIFTRDPDEADLYAGYVAPLSGAFETAHGHITHSFYCAKTLAAAALTDRSELFIIYSTADAKDVCVAEMLIECDRLNVESSRILAGKGRRGDLVTTKTLIYAVVTKLLTFFDAKTPPAPAILDLHWREVRNAQDYYLHAAMRHAKIDYFLGMMVGMVACAAMIAFSAMLMRDYSNLGSDGNTLVGCLVAGAVGAIVSVMSRMTFGELTLDYEAGRRILLMLGGFRPVIGMVLGSAMWVLSASGVLGIGPQGDGQMQYFHILTAFLAGFSERWAQDMLGGAADQIGTRGGPKRMLQKTQHKKGSAGNGSERTA